MLSLIRTFKPTRQLVNSFSSLTFNNEIKRDRHRIPRKRASKLLNILQYEEFERLKNGREFAGIQTGDSVQIDRLPYMSASEPDIIKGLVIGVVNKRSKSETALKLMNVEFGTPVYRRVILYNPLHKNVKILKKNFLHDGKKKVRRSKLYYLADKHPDLYTVK